MADLEEIAVERRAHQSPLFQFPDSCPVAKMAGTTEQDTPSGKSQVPLNQSTQNEGSKYTLPTEV